MKIKVSQLQLITGQKIDIQMLSHFFWPCPLSAHYGQKNRKILTVKVALYLCHRYSGRVLKEIEGGKHGYLLVRALQARAHLKLEAVENG